MKQIMGILAVGVLAASGLGCSTTPTVTYAHLPRADVPVPVATTGAKADPDQQGGMVKHGPAAPDPTSAAPPLPVATPASVATPIWSGGGDHSSHLPTTQNPADPDDGEFVFALTESTLLFPAPADKPGASSVCPKPAPGTTDGFELHKWKRCFVGLNPQPIPHASQDHLYAMKVDNGLTLQVAYQDDPLLVKSVTSNYKNPVTANVNRIGGEAAAGFALGGPWGAVGVVLVGEGLHAAAAAAAKPEMICSNGTCYQHIVAIAPSRAPSPQDLADANYMCIGKDDHYDLTAMKADPTLLLPVDLSHSLPADKGNACWRQFPKGDDQYSNGGWLYRVVEETKTPLRYSVPPVYYASTGKTPGGLMDWHFDTKELPDNQERAYFPASGCHAVILEVVWWEEAAKVALDSNNGIHRYSGFDVGDTVQTYHVTVADPTKLQLLQLSEGARTISVQGCGGRSSGVVATNAGDEVMSALMAQAQAVRTAQQSYEKNK